jgi:thiamine-monophosphate kinase
MTPGRKTSRRSMIKLSEFELIRKFVSGFSEQDSPWEYGSEVVIGPGDDASAILSPDSEDEVLLQTTDLLMEGIHFRKEWGTPYQLGWKSLAVNLSDIAAMGGRPLHTHLALALPRSWSEAEIVAFRRGFFDLAARYHVSLLGGDLSASPGPLVISVMVNGLAKRKKLLLRTGARVGDVIWVSGPCGEAGAGLRLLQGGSDGGEHPDLLRAFLQPEPEVEFGLVCAESGAVHAAIDISDGLAGDLGHILEKSHVGALIEEEKLPASDELKTCAAKNGWDLLELALRGGEEYHLIGCTPVAKLSSLRDLLAAKLNRQIYAIGYITRKSGLRLRLKSGKVVELNPTAFDHFA